MVARRRYTACLKAHLCHVEIGTGAVYQRFENESVSFHRYDGLVDADEAVARVRAAIREVDPARVEPKPGHYFSRVDSDSALSNRSRRSRMPS